MQTMTMWHEVSSNKTLHVVHVSTSRAKWRNQIQLDLALLLINHI
jgi:hypothetical protein